MLLEDILMLLFTKDYIPHAIIFVYAMYKLLLLRIDCIILNGELILFPIL